MTAPALLPLEVAAGLVWGFDPRLSPLIPNPTSSPLQTLDEIMVEALGRRPCVVSFSGGRDSSAVLAVAVDAARRHGLPLPVPVTMRFPHDPTAEESDWQESTIRLLGLNDWVRIALVEELDAIGPHAAPLLRRHGLMYPFNAYFHAPVAEQAERGVVMTGIGGDELFTRSRWRRVNELRTGTAVSGPRDLARLALAYGPTRLRGRVAGRRFVAPPWLTARATREVRWHVSAAAAWEAVEWDRSTIDTWWRSRVRAVGEAALDLVGDASGAGMIHPLSHPRFLASIAACAGERGFPSRTAAMSAVFGELLPRSVITRRTKAHFETTFWGAESRGFAASWDGSGLDPSVVRVDRLRELWSEPAPDPASMLLFQSAWLASLDHVSEPDPPTVR